MVVNQKKKSHSSRRSCGVVHSEPSQILIGIFYFVFAELNCKQNTTHSNVENSWKPSFATRTTSENQAISNRLFVKCMFYRNTREVFTASLMLHIKYIPLNFLWAFSFFVWMSESGQSCYVSLCFFIAPSFLILFNFCAKVLVESNDSTKNCLCHIGYGAKSM